MRYTIILLLLLSTLLQADEVRLVKNINTSTQSALDSSSTVFNIAELNNKLYYFAEVNGIQALYAYDESTGVAQSIKTFADAYDQHITVFNGRIYFAADDGTDIALWYSDGTLNGTSFINTNNDRPFDVAVAGDTLFFSVGQMYGKDLWVSENGTSALSVKSDIRPRFLHAAGNGVIFFQGYDETNKYELWISDGSSNGTYLFKIINAGTGSSDYSYPEKFISMGGWVYFTADDGEHGRELYKVDTSGSLALVKDINEGAGDNSPYYLTPYNGKLYFKATGAGLFSELYSSDGSDGGTTLVKAIGHGIYGLMVSNNILYITTSYGLWKSDGTETGTVPIIENTLTLQPNIHNNIMYNFNNKLYFTASSETNGSELWKSDGTSSGTVMLKDIDVGAGSSDPKFYIEMNGKLYFVADDKLHGRELWKSDGTALNTQLACDTNTAQNGSFPENFVSIGKTMYFMADDSVHGRELWKSDGTTNGTVMVADITPGSQGSELKNLYATDSLLYFTSTSSSLLRVSSPNYLWRSDGTQEGTYMLNGIALYDDYPHFAHIGNTVYFAGEKTSLARGGGDGEELFKSDGTITGTVMIKDIYPGSNSSNPRNIYTLGNKILFFAKDDTTNNQWSLFVSDGSEAGTIKVKDVHPYTGIGSYFSFRYANYATLNAYMYFFANAEDGDGIELYKSNGTPSGTVKVKNINATDSSNDGNEGATLLTLGNAVYFIAEDDLNGSALWKSDGTLEGTTMVKDVRLGTDDSGIDSYQQYNQLTKVGKQLFFKANDGVHGQEIWKSDGTTEGTVMVADLNQSDYSSFVAVGNLLYFSADNEASDPTSLWKTDGTAENTKIVAENNIYPSEKATGAMCPSLFFHGNKFTKTEEEWSYDDEEELWITKGDAQCGNKGVFPALYYLLF